MYIFDKPKEREPLQSDDQLLERFAEGQDQAAFGLIVKRYGPLVQRVCRGVGLHSHDVDDVFQATFLVVARKARTLGRKKHPLGAFVHGTAYRFALEGMRFGRRRRWHEKAAAKPESSSKTAGPEAQISLQEALSAVDGELDSMPEKYRVPLILHLIEGKSREEVASQLGMSFGTIRRRIEDGREMLRKRLIRRGIKMTVLVIPLVFAGSAEAAIAPALAVATAKSAALFVQGSAPATKATLMASSAVAGLSKLTGPSKVAATLKLWMSKTAVVALVGSACAGVWYETRSTKSPRANGFAGAPTALAVPAPGGPIVVRGRVLDEEGMSVPQARVTLLASRAVRGQHGQHDEVVLQGQADADGCFALEIPQDFPFWVAGRSQVKLLASAQDHPLGVTSVGLKSGPVSTEIRLGTAGAVRGQVVDKENRPVPGVAVHVVGFGLVGRELIQGSDEMRPESLPGWPQPIVTDKEGRFEFAGLDPKQGVRLEVRDDRFGRQLAVLESADRRVPARRDKRNEPIVSPDDITIKLAPPQLVEGQVLAADTGKPLPFARLSMVPAESPEGFRIDPQPRHHVDALADAEGRFRMQPLPGRKFNLFACGQDNDPYLSLVQEVPWPAGTAQKEINLALPRGIPLRGQVVEANTGRVVYGAQVQYTANLTANDVSPNREQARLWEGGSTFTDKEGTFFIPALPGRGELKVSFNRDDSRYLQRRSLEGATGGTITALARLPVEIPSSGHAQNVRLVVFRQGQLAGLVVDGAGQPVAGCTLLTAGEFAGTLFRAERRFQVRDGGFLIGSVGAEGKYPIVLIDPAHNQGLSTSIPGQVEESPPTFRLAPFGSAVGNLTTDRGRAQANAPIELAAVLTFEPFGKPVEETETSWYQEMNRDEPTVTTSRGKFTLPALIPGLRYRLYAGTGNSRRLVKEFTVEPGQKLQLGSLVVK